MGVQINLIGGFLEAGKTTFIQNLLQKSQFKDGKKTVLLCCEQGIEEYRERILERSNTTLIEVDDINLLDKSFFNSILEEYSPARILVEYNGTWEIEEFLKINLPDRCYINKIVSLADASTFQLYMSNMGTIMSEQFSNSDMVLVNRQAALNDESKGSVVRTLKNINRRAKTISYQKNIKDGIANQIADNYEIQGLYSGIKAFMVIIPLLLLYLFLISARDSGFSGNLIRLQALNTVFISILIQALPFILIGVFISSVLQIFVSDQRLAALFTRHKWLGFPMAVVLGVFFPVCDCAMAPITSRLVRKGVPLHYVITFLLAAPVVNPIVIVSTIYAFPDQREVVALRIGIGIVIALISGIFIKRGGITGEYALNQTSADAVCSSGFIGKSSGEGIAGRFEALLTHAGLEFFNVSRYVVLGAFITSVIQTFVPRASLAAIGANPVPAILIMLAAAVLMSVCSTSNAFIARSFSYSFPLYAVMCYMVMGPMLDLKNLLMLSSGFKKRFLAELVFVLIAIAILVFLFISLVI